MPESKYSKIESDIVIVPMERDDLPQVLAIEQASFPLPFSENLFLMELNLNIAHMLVAKEGKAPPAHACGTSSASQPLAGSPASVAGYLDFWHAEQGMHVVNIAVHPEKRRRGIGRLMMQYLIDYSEKHNVTQTYLDVRESNQAAICLYESFGFRRIDVRKGYYQDNEEDALVMERKS